MTDRPKPYTFVGRSLLDREYREIKEIKEIVTKFPKLPKFLKFPVLRSQPTAKKS